MWVFTLDGFFSIVKDQLRPGRLLVRGRIKGQIERAFPRARVLETPTNDYPYRASLTEDQVDRYMSKQVNRIRYGNFKAALRDATYHNACLDVWLAMRRAQDREDDNMSGDPTRYGGLFNDDEWLLMEDDK